VQTLQDALDWMWRHANIVRKGDPWTRSGLRSAMVGDPYDELTQASGNHHFPSLEVSG
jgi:hypothetical protein